MDALANLGAKELAPQVAEHLGDDGLGVKAACIELLGRLGARKYAPEIARLLKDDAAWDVRWKGAEAIGRIGSLEEAPLMATLLKSESLLIRSSALRALGELDAQGLASVVIEYLKHEDDSTRSAAVFALGRMGTNGCAPQIVPLLQDRGMWVRMGAARALGDLAATEFSSDIARLLKDPYEDVRVCAADVLCRLGRREGIKILLGPIWDSRRMLVSLNALRFPEGWRRLKNRSLKGSEWINRKDALKRLASEAGLVLDMSEEVERDPFWGLTVYIGGETNLVCALEASLDGDSWDAVLEEKSLRIVPHDEALTYWKKWCKHD